MEGTKSRPRTTSVTAIKESSTVTAAALPSKDALYAKVLGTMLAPITSLAVVLGQIVEKSGGSVESKDESAEAEAPAAE